MPDRDPTMIKSPKEVTKQNESRLAFLTIFA
jgi:hypothetical protein